MSWGFHKPRRIIEEYFEEHFGIQHKNKNENKDANLAVSKMQEHTD